MNKKLLTILLCFPLVSCASNHVPLPKKGLEIVPFAQMDVPDSFKQEFNKKMKEVKIKGYAETDNTYARDLLAYKQSAKPEIEQYKNDLNPYDTHFKGNLSDIKLSFPFKELSAVKKEDVLAYVPEGGYVKGVNIIKPYKEGWTGMGVFFTNGQKEVCSYDYFNLKASKGAVQMGKENTTYVVNNKPTFTIIEGNLNNGFIYSVSWNDEIGDHKLECANMQFDKEIMKTTIALANKIDKQA